MGRPRVLTNEQREARRKEYMRKYWLENKDKIKAVRKNNPNNAVYHKRWTEKNMDHLKEYRHEYIEKNREKINAYHREYYRRKKANLVEVLKSDSLRKEILEKSSKDYNELLDKAEEV